MHAEVHGLDGFYASPLGAVTRRLLRARLRAIWPELTGRDVLGFGHAGPYLRLWRRGAARLVSATPSSLHGPPAAPWPPDGPCAAALVEEENLPFPDLSFDNILVIHGLEASDHTRRLLRELWRVLRDEGRLLMVIPNRRSVWAHLDNTPFGQGQPYSTGQAERLLARSLFAVERRDTALFMPPFRSKLLLRTGRAWERAGHALLPRLGGVTLLEARKTTLGVLPTTPARSPRRVLVRA